MNHTLPKKQFEILIALCTYRARTQDNKTFCRKDNCFQLGIDKMCRITKQPNGTTKRLFTSMRDQDLVRCVTDVTGDARNMLNPSFLSFTDNKWDTMFQKAMYHLGSHTKAVEWAEFSRADGKLYDYKTFQVDHETGEFIAESLRPLLPEETEAWHLRSRPLGKKAEEYAQDMNNKPTDEDFDWWNKVNDWSDHIYPTISKLSSSSTQRFEALMRKLGK